MKVPGWVCDLGDGEFDHDWEIVVDWDGDPEVINGTFDCSFKRCRQCGEEAPIEHGVAEARRLWPELIDDEE